MSTVAKVDYKRELRELYAPGRTPAIVDVPELACAMIDGHGDPNTTPEFSEAMEALFTVSYTAKFDVKRSPGGVDYGVMPPEGQFWIPDMAKFATAAKADWDWTLMIMQPDCVSEEVFAAALATGAKKKPLAALSRLRLERFTEGLAAQVLHVGPYSAEAPTIRALHAFIAEQGRELRGRHHEIYLSDPRRAAPERMKTVIRQPIA